MLRVNNIFEIKNALSVIEDNGVEWHTNFLERDEEVNGWIKKRQLYMMAIDRCVFLYRNRTDCSRLYFTCSDVADLVYGLQEIVNGSKEKIIIKILQNNSTSSIVKEKILEAGFRYYTSLKRVVRMNSGINKSHKEGVYACLSDQARIKEIIRGNFDKLLDQWPDDDEILKAIEEKRILVARNSETNDVIAMQSFQRIGKTLYGRYLASLQECRGKMAYGPILWRQCIKQNSDVKRIIGWIDERNELAIRVNKAMGFTFDGVSEEVFIFG